MLGWPTQPGELELGHATRVIVADDDPLIRKLLQELLRKDGYEVDACPDGCSALELALADEPELLILDVEMPGKTGPEVVRMLRARRCLAPVLLISGDEDPPGLPAALALSGVSFLPKPFRIGECRRAVGAAVGARR